VAYLISRLVKAVRRAVIDVGTNSIKLLVGEVSGNEVRPLLEDSKQTRLGQDFYQTYHLQTAAIAASAQAAANFADVAREMNAATIRVIATSAARDAVNSVELTAAIESAAGLKVEIISGEQEANWVFQGATTDGTMAHLPILLLDAGGGSAEFILGRGKQKHFTQSLPLGSVRLLENFPPSDPPRQEELTACRGWVREFLKKELWPNLEPALQKEPDEAVRLVGTGGTTSILARMETRLEEYDRARIEATRLGLDRLRWHVNHLWSLPLDRRKEIVGLPRSRADVILFGAVIYESVMEQFGFTELHISTRGLRFAVLIEG